MTISDAGNLIGPLGALVLPVTDLERSVAFYRDVIGAEVRSVAPPWAHFDCGGFLLALVAAPLGVPEGFAHSVTFRVADVDAAAATLEARGVEFPGGIRQFFGDEFGANFTDPDGHSLAIMGPRG